MLSSEHVFDSKFPVVVLPHSSMLDEGVKAHVHATVGKVLAWSLRCASTELLRSQVHLMNHFSVRGLSLVASSWPMGGRVVSLGFALMRKLGRK